MGFAAHAVAAPLMEREAALNAVGGKGYNQVVKPAQKREPLMEREAALNAVGGKSYGQVVKPQKRHVNNAADGAEKRNVEERALNAGYKESFQNEAPEKRALNAGYNQIYKPAEDLVERDPEPALNAGYKQIINNEDSIEKREAKSGVTSSYNQCTAKPNKRALNACGLARAAKPVEKREAEPALNAGYNQIINNEDVVEKREAKPPVTTSYLQCTKQNKRALNACGLAPAAKPVEKREAEPALNAGTTYKQVVYPGSTE